MKPTSLFTPLVILAAFSTFTLQAAVVFQDTFNIDGPGVLENIDTGYTARQTGGTLTSTYGDDGTNGASIDPSNNFLEFDGSGSLELQTDFASGIDNFTLSFEARSPITSPWVNMSISNNRNHFQAPISLFLQPKFPNKIFVYSGTEGTPADVNTTFTQEDLDTLNGGAFDITAWNTYTIVGTAGATANTGTFDLLLNGNLLMDNFDYAFSGNARYLELANGGADSSWDVDNLQLTPVPEPAAAALALGLVAFGLIFVRRRSSDRSI